MTARPVTTDHAARQSPGQPGGAAANGAPPTQPGGPPANGAPPGRAGGPGAGHGGGPPGGPGGEKAGLRRTFSAFQYRKYRLLWISMAVGMTGMQMQMIAQGLLAYELSGTFTAVGVLAMAWGVPQFFFALPGGAIADRMDKRRILLITQVAVMAQAIVIGLAITTDVITLPILFVVGVFMGATFSFNMPARQAFIPEVVPREQMMNAIALNNTAMNATRIFSPLAAGLFISWWGFDVTYYITGAMYGVGWITALLLPRSTAHLNRVKRWMFDQIGIGLRYETQTNLGDRNNIDPRLGFAYSIGSSTVIRGGSGIFHQRLRRGTVGQLIQFDGTRQRSLTIRNPSYPDPFLSDTGEAIVRVPSSIRVRADDLTAPYTWNSEVSIETSFSEGLVLTGAYRFVRGVHLFRGRNLNSPLDVTSAIPRSCQPGQDELTCLPPDPSRGRIVQLESTGTSRNQSLRLGFRQRFSFVNINGNYTLESNYTDATGSFGLPADNHDLGAEWARVSPKHRLNTSVNFRTATTAPVEASG